MQKKHENIKEVRNTPNIVLVKAKKWMWPAEVVERDGDMLQVKMFKDDLVKSVSEDNVIAFNINLEPIKDTKNSALRKAEVCLFHSLSTKCSM